MDKTPELESYKKLKAHFQHIANLNNASSILHNEMITRMPAGSAEDRQNQLATLSAMEHRLITDPAARQWLEDAERVMNNEIIRQWDKSAGEHAFSEGDYRNLALMRKAIEQGAVPDELAEEEARLMNEGMPKHTSIGKTGDWAQMKDWYRHSFDTIREIGRDRKERLGFSSIYEALLDSFSPGTKADHVAQELGKMEKALPGLIREAAQKQALEEPATALSGTFPKEQQEELCRRVVTAMGFDFSRGRFDFITGHPSCGGTSDDTRLTTFFDEKNFLKALTAVIHECGHGLYSQNLPGEWRYQPAGRDLGMAVHESQSRIMEVQAAGTPEFFEYLETQAREVFGRPDDETLAAENLRKLKQTVAPSFIRVYADEITYPAHIILRHKLESAIIEGNLDIEDLPQAWNDGMQNLLGIVPSNHAQGCMQDVHWPIGAIGYFPSYTLGDMGAAQFFAAACKDRPEIRSELRHGNFTPLREWLRDNVHSKGSLLTADELFTQATGEKLNADYYLEHLSQRYLGKPYQASMKASVAAGKAPERKPG